MATDRILDRLRHLIAELCDLESEKVRPEGKLLGYGMDSVRVLDLLMALEDEYGVDLPETDPELATVQTVSDLATLVERRRRG